MDRNRHLSPLIPLVAPHVPQQAHLTCGSMVAKSAPTALDSKTALKLCTKLCSGVESRAAQTAAVQLAQLLQKCPGVGTDVRRAGGIRKLQAFTGATVPHAARDAAATALRAMGEEITAPTIEEHYVTVSAAVNCHADMAQHKAALAEASARRRPAPPSPKVARKRTAAAREAKAASPATPAEPPAPSPRRMGLRSGGLLGANDASKLYAQRVMRAKRANEARSYCGSPSIAGVQVVPDGVQPHKKMRRSSCLAA